MGGRVKTWWDVPGIEKPVTLRLAIAKATGVSGGSASRITAMLMPDELGGWGGVQIKDPKRLKDGKIEDLDCFRLEGERGNQPMTLWIDKKEYLVRRIDQKMQFANYRVEQTTTYKPVLNGKITPAMLKFDPPNKGKSSR